MANRVSFIVIAKDAFTRVAKNVSKETRVMQRGFTGLGKKLRLTSRRFDGLVTAAIGFLGLRKFFTTGIQFEDAIADLAAITGAAGKDLQFLSDESLRLAKIAKVSGAETATAFKLVASAKAELLENPKALSNVTEQVLLLANASGVGLSESATVVTEALNQFAAGADQAARFVNVLAAGAKFGASEVGQTGVAIVKSGVAARMAGLSFEELNATIQVLAQSGIKAEIAGTSLKTSLLKLEATGIKKIMPSVVGFTEALENLGKMNLSTTKLSKLFGLEAINTGSILIENAGKVKVMISKLTGTSIAAQQASIRLGTLGKKLKGLQIIVEDALIKTFLKLEEDKVFSNLTTDLAGFIEQIKGDDIAKFADSMKVIANAVANIAKFTGKGIAGLSRAGEILGTSAAAATTGGFATAAEFTPTALLISALTGSGKNEAEVNINLNAPVGVIDSVKTTAKSPQLKVGTNMETQP